MEQNKLEHYRQLLLKEKNRLDYELARLNDEESLSLKESTGELSSYDNHPADQGSNTYERGKDLGLIDNTQTLLKQVGDALEKLESGEYGACQRCGEEIRDERLETVPYTTLCERCKAKEEALNFTRERPFAEEYLGPPFGKGFNDETDRVEFDAEDSWQAVAQYGTSNTPQDNPEAAVSPGPEAYMDADETVGSVGIEDTIFDDEADDIEGTAKKRTSFTGRKGEDNR